jgi:selenide, water dikinase
MSENIKLTQTVQKGGCAAKVAAAELRQILAQVKFPQLQSNVMVDGSLMDDAAIIRVSDELALVQTLDFFTPIVDSPYLFGQIAAANSLSDVYAMGGRPQTALAILAFPLATMSQAVIVEVLQGASDKIAEAQSSFVGGHSIDDDTLKFGLSVTGYVNPEKIWKNSGAQTGDILILTKALGTGSATSALKRGEVTEKEIHEEISSMAQLNNILSLLTETQKNAIHAATDVTGFGFAGHAVQMARASRKKFIFNMKSIPRFEKTLQYFEAGFLTKAHRTNKDYVAKEIQFEGGSELESQLLYDPQTSGGLLLSVHKDEAQGFIQSLKSQNKFVSIVGQVSEADQSTPLQILK